MPKELLDNEAAARYLGIAPATLNTLRCRGDSPPYYKVGRRVLMDRADLDTWLEARRRQNSSETIVRPSTRARR
jgi:excisionase family DNA binding protein